MLLAHEPNIKSRTDIFKNIPRANIIINIMANIDGSFEDKIITLLSSQGTISSNVSSMLLNNVINLNIEQVTGIPALTGNLSISELYMQLTQWQIDNNLVNIDIRLIQPLSRLLEPFNNALLDSGLILQLGSSGYMVGSSELGIVDNFFFTAIRLSLVAAEATLPQDCTIDDLVDKTGSNMRRLIDSGFRIPHMDCLKNAKKYLIPK